ncbi:hypothetical protein [Actinomyces naeslundii]|uniref:hypothetical protein n=1 Tax=Actinomyces naeslundii TaxID=1655 RepID=UPI0020936583|nr:hypothetical protein [Actinomyces naeslundii]
MTPTVTLRRLAAWLAECGYGYDIDLSEGLVRSSVAGFDYVLTVVNRRILAVRAHHDLGGPAPSAAMLSRVRAVAQEVSGGRLIPALYTEVDDAGLSLCAEVLTNIGAGLDDAQLAGTMDFILDGVDEALREVLGVLDEAAGPTGTETAGETTAREAVAVALPDTTQTPEMAAVVSGPGTDAYTQSRAEGDSRADSEVGSESAAEVDTESDAGVNSDKDMIALGDAEGGTGVETTDTPEPVLVS